MLFKKRRLENYLQDFGGDPTLVNIGWEEGVITYLEKQTGKKISLECM